MKRNIIILSCVTILGSHLTGCGTTPTDSEVEFSPTLYIEGYLVAGKSVTDIFVATTAPLYELYDRNQNAVPNAILTIEVDGILNGLSPTSDRPGYYHSVDLVVQSGKTYRLSVNADELSAQAETTVPFPPSLTVSGTDLIFNELEFSASWSGITEVGYVTTRKLEVIGEPIPLELQFGRFAGGRPGGFGGTVDTTGLSAFQDSIAAVRDSLSQADQWRFVQGTALTLGWQQFSNYGTYSFQVHTIDSNYADFLASSTQDPQFLDEPRFHVTGGIGIFASMAPSSVTFVVRE